MFCPLPFIIYIVNKNIFSDLSANSPSGLTTMSPEKAKSRGVLKTADKSPGRSQTADQKASHDSNHKSVQEGVTTSPSVASSYDETSSSEEESEDENGAEVDMRALKDRLLKQVRISHNYTRIEVIQLSAVIYVYPMDFNDVHI